LIAPAGAVGYMRVFGGAVIGMSNRFIQVCPRLVLMQARVRLLAC